MSFLDRLVAEWYEYCGYSILPHKIAGEQKNGSSGAEHGVLAYLRSEHRIIHIETSNDASSWPDLKRNFLEKRFVLRHDEYEALIGESLGKIEKIAVAGWGLSTKINRSWGDGMVVVLISELFQDKGSIRSDPNCSGSISH